MEQKKINTKRKAYGVLITAFLEFIGRTAGNAILGFLRASIGGVILAYPFKWIWNGLALKLTEYKILEINYWTAFSLLFLIGVLFRRQVVITEKESKDEIEGYNE